MNKKENSFSSELSEIRKALDIAENNRFATTLTALQRKELEQASIVLRNRERELTTQTGKEIAESLKNSGTQLENLAKEIKIHTKRMGQTTQSLNKIKKALLLISKLP